MNESQVRRTAIAALLGAKLLVLSFAALAWPIAQDQPIESAWQLLENWNRWDAPHYLSIAEHGYQDRGDARNFLVFFPLFPWLVRTVAVVVREPLLAAFLVSTVASVAAAAMLAVLGERELGPGVGLRSVWALAAFPTAYFLHIGYTESLFLALALASFSAARSGRWAWAAIAGLGAVLTRSAGIAIVPALAVEAFSQKRESKGSGLRALGLSALCSLLPAAGLVIYFGINQLVTGNAFTFLEIQRRHWFKSLAPPWVGLREVLYSFERGPSEAALLGGQELLFAAVGLVATIAAFRHLRPSYAVWMAGNWFLFVGTSWVMSVPRYTLALFPIFWLLALAARKPTTGYLLLLGSVLLQALFALRFSQGYWAF